uniref:Uncharacterized protein n=1 Tax=Thermodesulfobium narugense TaxID=184064 RepID=A0A7C5KD23_9BACT
MVLVPERNALGIFIFLIFLIFFLFSATIVYYFFEQFSDTFLSTKEAQPFTSELTDIKNSILDTSTAITDGLKLIFYILLGATILSTAFAPSNFFSMLQHFIILIIISSILTYIFGVIYNAIVLEFSKTPDSPMLQTVYSRMASALTDFSVVFTNFNFILIGNLIATIINVLMPKFSGGLDFAGGGQ